jgi:hypothetical protein
LVEIRGGGVAFEQHWTGNPYHWLARTENGKPQQGGIFKLDGTFLDESFLLPRCIAPLVAKAIAIPIVDGFSLDLRRVSGICPKASTD